MRNKETVEIDFDVWRELTARRSSKEVTYNDVIRGLLGWHLEWEQWKAESPDGPRGEPWVQKGVTFPHGTKFRATYKGRLYEAVVDDGALLMDGKREKSTSGAARAVTGTSVDGWRFWECKMPGSDSWRPISEYK